MPGPAVASAAAVKTLGKRGRIGFIAKTSQRGEDGSFLWATARLQTNTIIKGKKYCIFWTWLQLGNGLLLHSGKSKEIAGCLMKLTLTKRPDRHHITVEETRLDAAVATAFKDRIREVLVDAPGLVVLDLGRVDFMDSSGLGAVIWALKAMPSDKRLELTSLTPNVERVFRLTRMDSVFNFRSTPDDPGDPRHQPPA